jgi:hypothetical protein
MTYLAAEHEQTHDLESKLLENVRGSTPLAIEQIDILLRLLAAGNERITTFLCLGGDLAVLATAILEEHPNARGRLLSSSHEDAWVAQATLRAHAGRITIAQAGDDCAYWLDSETRSSFDAIICGSLLEESGAHRRDLFCKTFGLLKPGGLFLNVANVASATRWTGSVLDDYLIDAIFGEELRCGAGKNRAEIARQHFEKMVRTSGGRTPPLEVQCDWLRESGFENVDCYSKVEELAVYGGQKLI